MSVARAASRGAVKPAEKKPVAKKPRVRKKAAAPAGPPVARHVLHPKRPEWGVGLVLDESNGKIRVQFADGTTRAFLDGVLEAVKAST